jgi:hypothetical protein
MKNDWMKMNATLALLGMMAVSTMGFAQTSAAPAPKNDLTGVLGRLLRLPRPAARSEAAALKAAALHLNLCETPALAAARSDCGQLKAYSSLLLACSRSGGEAASL